VSSRFRKLSHSIWHCQYHIVWVPKYRFRVLQGKVKEAVDSGIHAICGYAGCEVVELNVQPDHIHLIVMIPPKVSISNFLGRLKGQTSMKLFQQFRHLRKKPYWGNHFLGQGLLRRYRRHGCGHDTQVCPLSGEARTANGTTSVSGLRTEVRHSSSPPPWGQGQPPYGGRTTKPRPVGVDSLLI